MWTIGLFVMFLYLNAGRILAGKFDEEDDGDVKDNKRLWRIGQILYLPLEVIGLFLGKLAKISGAALYHLYFAPALLLERSKKLEKPIRRFKGSREVRRLQAAEDKKDKEDKAKRLADGKQEVERVVDGFPEPNPAEPESAGIKNPKVLSPKGHSSK